MDKIDVDKDNKFMKLFQCAHCKVKSKGLEKHQQHMEVKHSDIKFSLECLFKECEYATNNPKVLMKRFGEKHDTVVAQDGIYVKKNQKNQD